MRRPELLRKNRKGVSPARNIVAGVVLVALCVVAYVEFSAHSAAKAANQKLEKVLENEEGDLLSMDEVNKLIGRQPDGPGVVDGERLLVNYTWRGVFRKHTISTVYKPGSTPRLLQIGEASSDKSAQP